MRVLLACDVKSRLAATAVIVMGGMNEREQAIAELAARQCGVVSARQLRNAGFGRGAISRRLRLGRLHRLHRGIYLVGHPVAPEGAAETAALLACGPGSVISHRSAARLWDLGIADASGGVEVTVIVGCDPRHRPGIRVHHVRRLDPRDVRRVHGLAVTAPARTLLDLAAVLPLDDFECAFAAAQGRGLVRDRDLADQLKRCGGRRGAKAFRLLVDRSRGQGLTRSEAERRLVRLLLAAELPEPKTNARLGRLEVDFLWSAQGVIVEVDGFKHHSGAVAFERDRDRDGALVAKGYAVTRITWHQLVARPEAVVARIAAALAVRSKTP